jgi:type VI secretion system secreted protein Hcp
MRKLIVGKRRRRTLWLVASLATLAACAGSVAYATIPDAGAVIHGCASKEGGALRAIDTDKGETCKSNEFPVNWNQTGPKGADGAPGKDGATGPAGPAGSSTPDRPAIGTLDATGKKQGVIAAADPIVGIDWGVDVPTDAATGLPTGKRQHKPLVVTKELDAATPLLDNAAFTNEILTPLAVNLTHQGDSTPYLRITLTNAEIRSVHDFSEGGKQYEEVAFTYQKIEILHIASTHVAEDDWSTPSA